MQHQRKPVIFDEPFTGETLDRLRTIFLYYDEIEVLDHSYLIDEFEKDNWAAIWNPQKIREEVEKLARQYGIKDRNEINRRFQQARKATEDRRKYVTNLLDRTYAPHKTYWKFLRELGQAGHVRVVAPDLDVPAREIVHPDKAKSAATAVTAEFTPWLKEYMTRSGSFALDAQGEDAIGGTIGVIAMILFAHVLTGVMYQVQGRELYSGDDILVRTLSRFSNTPKPVAAKLAETVLNLEVPRIAVSEFDELGEVKSKLKELREQFQIEMRAISAHLIDHEWNEDLLKELEVVRLSKIEPVLFDLRRKLEEHNLPRALTDAKDTIIGTASLGLGLAVSAGASLNAQLLATALGAGAGGLFGAMNFFREERIAFDQNRLAYVIQVKRRLK
jgi:hypothetical protein